MMALSLVVLLPDLYPVKMIKQVLLYMSILYGPISEKNLPLFLQMQGTYSWLVFILFCSHIFKVEKWVYIILLEIQKDLCLL